LERLAPNRLCTILLLDEAGRHLQSISGPSMRPEYMASLDGLEIGPEVGACGSAAFRNQTVIVEDIATDSRFAGVKDHVTAFGLRSCYSVPIRDSKHNVLGVLAMYHARPGTPRPQERRLVEAGARLAGNAIERLRAEPPDENRTADCHCGYDGKCHARWKATLPGSRNGLLPFQASGGWPALRSD
jgi:GAF domain-containing protein